MDTHEDERYLTEKRLKRARERELVSFFYWRRGHRSLVIFSPPYHLLGAGEEETPTGYFEDPSIMLQFQVEGIRQYLKIQKTIMSPPM